MSFVLVLVVFFYGSTGNPPESVSRAYATPAECLAAKSAYVAKATASPKVSYAQGMCVGVREGSKL